MKWKKLNCSLNGASYRSYVSQALVPHIYKPSYSGGRDQEDRCPEPTWANSLWDRILKMPNTKKRAGVAQVVEHLPSK
jgi:hypothetical protein